MFTFVKFFSQAYLIWAPKLGVPEIGIPVNRLKIHPDEIDIVALKDRVNHELQIYHGKVNPNNCMLSTKMQSFQ